MSSSSSNDSWYQDVTATQNGSEHFEKAELLNGRLAMLGLVIGLFTEAITSRGIVDQIVFGIFGCN
ncbi:chlorophyll a/b-binding protein [Synechococcus sp. M16CYN]|uniref:chlorophyll a/b-binding protein n=1 Tax=Synechococcus sp. M16CYN TaxID=3103139 RepID=UPI003246E1DA